MRLSLEAVLAIAVGLIIVLVVCVAAYAVPNYSLQNADHTNCASSAASLGPESSHFQLPISVAVLICAPVGTGAWPER